MKIAIVTPHPVPLAIGGAENLWWGLQDHFQNHTVHECDVIALLSPEASFWDLISSYEAFSKLDLSAYDCVISGKYPAWMVNHPNHICYMLHRLRGLYDTYAPPAEDHTVLRLPKLRNLVEWLDDAGRYPDPEQIPDLFDKLRSLKDAGLPESVFAFPGPFIRKIVHFLDNAALSPQRIRRYAAIAETVRQRKNYFPPDAMVDVLYPPPHRSDYREGDFRYLFTSSRLDRPKRVDLIVEAMKHVSEAIPLLIAGTGPDEARLKALAGNDQRIQFLGFVPDEAMSALYADALAVPFVPYDEDYGLVTIEAMRSGKPVLTFADSGGPCEFVHDGETGFVTAPSAKALAERISELARNPQLARQMGERAKGEVAPVIWDNAASGLLQSVPHATAERPARRKKLTVATTFRVFPPMNGGQARVYHLYKNLAKIFDIDIVSLGIATDLRSEKEIAPGLVEIHIPKSEAHAEAERDLSNLTGHIPIGDIAAYPLIGLTPAFDDALELSAMTSDAVVACHPYLIQALRKAAPDKPLWYEAQDVEITLKSAMFAGKPEGQPLLEEVKSAEKSCWISAERVFACADRDLKELQSIYGPTRARVYEVPNGVALDEIPFTDLQTRRHIQARSGLSGRQTAIFMGSWHGPNLEAIEEILQSAEQAPKTRFIVMGSACIPFKDRKKPTNVHLLGQVDETTRNSLLASADVALNPMHSGSGTNLKMLDYFAAGIPVVSTMFGARGLEVQPEIHFLASDAGLAATLDKLAQFDDMRLSSMIASARRLVEEHYSWKVIAERFADRLADSGFSLTRG
ncbi:glycosyltransferase [Pseudorhizobium flavum]|uniref:Glycosyltransferase involved in cell wall biosynthesis n=1 Tax=Pseudorhizobium flavum TaxID=1335061 RepID=A0A7W9Z113_9HYPH|nr:glycosyltransferase [Pseudorhizobium flavum]MBB6182070.1 glycosyltransferase involved in cell wall biosynthesis [Pseudorhizobium flavum]CAD6632182.1 glycosyl transferase family 1 [Pseudorhizobium flavum]